MKLSLRVVRVVLAPSLALSLGVVLALATGCAGAAQSATAASAASTPVGTTSITSATVAPSGLAPAAWDGDEAEPMAAAAPRAPTARLAPPTWGAAVVVRSPTNTN